MKNGPEAEIIKTDNHDPESLCLECPYKSRPYPEFITDIGWEFYSQAAQQLGVTLCKLNTFGDNYVYCNSTFPKCDYDLFLFDSGVMAVNVEIDPKVPVTKTAFDDKVMDLARAAQASGLIKIEKLQKISKKDGKLQRIKRRGFLLDDLIATHIKHIRPNKVNGSGEIDL